MEIGVGIIGWEWCGRFWLRTQASGVLCEGVKWFVAGGGIVARQRRYSVRLPRKALPNVDGLFTFTGIVTGHIIAYAKVHFFMTSC